MEAYIMRDTDPDGGLLTVTRSYPVMSDQKRTVIEVRKVDFPMDTYMYLMFGEIAPEEDTFHDKLLQPYFDKGEEIWTRKGGEVNGSE